MKVYISKYRYHWISPYTILGTLCFWEKDKDVFYNLDDDPNNKYIKAVNFLEHVSKGLQKVLDFIYPRIEYVKIDKYDTWNMDSTLAVIILPMLKQLKDTKHGSPIVDDEDLPYDMATINHEEYDAQSTFDWYHGPMPARYANSIHDRWDWVLDEMIWAFENYIDENCDSQFHSGEHDYRSVPCKWDENGKPTLFSFEQGPNHTAVFDEVGFNKHHERINNGFRLFGKYYRNLWD